MSDLLVRDISEETKLWLIKRARSSGRSQSAEVRALLDDAAAADIGLEKNPFITFYQACQVDGGYDEFVVPKRHPARTPRVWWLDDDAIAEEDSSAKERQTGIA